MMSLRIKTEKKRKRTNKGKIEKTPKKPKATVLQQISNLGLFFSGTVFLAATLKFGLI